MYVNIFLQPELLEHIFIFYEHYIIFYVIKISGANDIQTECLIVFTGSSYRVLLSGGLKGLFEKLILVYRDVHMES